MNTLPDYVEVRHPFQRVRVQTCVRSPSLTHQSHRDSCDINAIVKRYERGHVLPTRSGEPQYADLTPYTRPLAEQIDESRAVLEEAGKMVETQNKRRVKEAQDKQMDLEKEVERLRALEKTVKENREE